MNDGLLIKSLMHLWTKKNWDEIFIFWPQCPWQEMSDSIKKTPHGLFIIIGYDVLMLEQYHLLDNWLTENHIQGNFFLLNEDFLHPTQLTQNLKIVVPVGLCWNTLSNLASLLDMRYNVNKDFLMDTVDPFPTWLALSRTQRRHRRYVKENWLDKLSSEFTYSAGPAKFFGNINFYNQENYGPDIANALNFFSLKDIYNSTCGSVVLESCAITPLTEKTFHAILALHPFMIVSQPGTIKYLRDQGFDVFDDIIDHAYDNIENLEARIDRLFVDNQQLILNKIDRKSILTRLLKNRENVWTYYDNQMQHLESTLKQHLLEKLP
jgi:hypothetical protein